MRHLEKSWRALAFSSWGRGSRTCLKDTTACRPTRGGRAGVHVPRGLADAFTPLALPPQVFAHHLNRVGAAARPFTGQSDAPAERAGAGFDNIFCHLQTDHPVDKRTGPQLPPTLVFFHTKHRAEEARLTSKLSFRFGAMCRKPTILCRASGWWARQSCRQIYMGLVFVSSHFIQGRTAICALGRHISRLGSGSALQG